MLSLSQGFITGLLQKLQSGYKTFGECYDYITSILKFNENTEIFIEEDTSEPPIINTVKYKFCIHSKPDNKYKTHVFVDGEAIITCGTIQNLSRDDLGWKSIRVLLQW